MKEKDIVVISPKGQLLIPKYYRERIGIRAGGKVALSIDDKKLIVNPLPDDPIKASRGFLKGGRSLREQLLKERRAETKKDKTVRH